MANYKEPDVDQYRMVTLNFSELFPKDHFLHRLLELIRKFDLKAFDEGYTNDSPKGGRPAIPVDRMLAVIVYSLLYGNISMRNLERDLAQRADLMFLSGGLTIDHSTVSVFRKRHAQAICELFSQTVFLGIEAGLIDLDTVCIDSTTIKASANRRDIGTKEQLKKRLEKIKEVCAKRYRQWESADDESEKEYLERKIQGYKKMEEKIEAGMEFLKKNRSRERVHLNDPDADWHKDGSNHFVVGYKTQAAVDAKTKMVVYQEVVKGQNDSAYTLEVIDKVEIIRKKAGRENHKPKYVLDCGYASEDNYRALKGRDVYMPDPEYARVLGGKVKPEDRVENAGGYLKFEYHPDEDIFTCPQGGSLKFSRIQTTGKYEYRTYRKTGCGKCEIRAECAGKPTRKEVSIRATDYRMVAIKYMPKRGGTKKKQPVWCTPYAMKMREKLELPEARKVYAKRFEVSEGPFGVLKYTRKCWQFLRRELKNVQTESDERFTAYNIAKLLNYTRT